MKKSNELSAIAALVLTLGATNAWSVPVDIYGKRPLSFELNQGQTDPLVKFLSRGQGYTLYLTASEAVLTLTKHAVRSGHVNAEPGQSAKQIRPSRSILRMSLVDANPTPHIEGVDQLPGKSHYFIGADPDQWHRNVPHYAKVRYQEVYPGVDLVFYGNQRQLEYDFVVAPGATVDDIALRFQGADAVELDRGDLVLQTPGGEVRLTKPVIYQESEGAREPIDGGFVLKGAGQVAFQVAAYDLERPLIIDPVLVFATYVAGTEQDDPSDIAIDAFGNVYITGDTDSDDYPTEMGSFDEVGGGGDDVFVTKLSADGSSRIYSTYIGGAGDDVASSIAVDAMGNAYVTGEAESGYPPMGSTISGAPAVGESDAFVTKLSIDGSALVYSTFLGAGDGANGVSIAVDGDGNAFVTGRVRSGGLVTTDGAYQPEFAGGEDGDAFVAKLNLDGSAFHYATFLGGEADDRGESIAVDAMGFAYVTGFTRSEFFKIVPGSYDTICGDDSSPACNDADAFVTKLNLTGTDLIYSTFLGGDGSDKGRGVAVDSAGNAYITGVTGSADFPTKNAFDAACDAETLPPTPPTCTSGDAFVTKLNPAGDGLVYSTYLGGKDGNEVPSSGHPIAIDSFGNVYVSGRTLSTDFPAVDAIQPTFGGLADGFLTKLDPDGSVVYSTYLGDAGNQTGRGVAVDGVGTAYVVIKTFSPSSTMFLTTLSPNPAGPSESVGIFGRSDAYVVKIAIGGDTATGTDVVVQPVATTTGESTVSVTFNTVATAGTTTLEVSDIGPALPEGFSLGDPPTFFDISTDATVTDPIVVCIDYSGITFPDESALQLLHFEDPDWIDSTITRDPVNNVICGSVMSLSQFAVMTPSASSLTISIDIKPGSDPNCFNINGHGVIPVAILGSETFFVTEIDLGTLRFAGLDVRIRGNKGPLCHLDDSNGDGDPDLVCQFEDDSTLWAPGAGTATITGMLLDGGEFQGTDSICIVP